MKDSQGRSLRQYCEIRNRFRDGTQRSKGKLGGEERIAMMDIGDSVEMADEAVFAEICEKEGRSCTPGESFPLFVLAVSSS